MYLKEMKSLDQEDAFTPTFITVEFLAKISEQLRCLSINAWRDRMGLFTQWNIAQSWEE